MPKRNNPDYHIHTVVLVDMDSDLIKGRHVTDLAKIRGGYILRRRPYFAPKIQIELIPF